MPTERQMPQYQSHKKVWALKIAAMEVFEDHQAKIAPADPGFDTFFTRPGWANRFEGGEDDLGYYVVYSDGFSSWSPSEAFEKGYTPLRQSVAPGNPVLEAIKNAADVLDREAPSRERSLAQTKLDEARLWAVEAQQKG